MTNGDMIRQMSDKELFDNFIFKMYCGYCQFRNECPLEDVDDECEKFWMSWLKQESEEKQREHIGILPVPCTKVEEETVKEWFHKINEELDEFKKLLGHRCLQHLTRFAMFLGKICPKRLLM